MWEKIRDDLIPALAQVVRMAFLFIPMTLVGPMLFFAILYWWFVPASMRLDLPLSFPSTGLKIVASLLALPMLLVSRHSSEVLASSLPEKCTTSLYRIVSPAAFILRILFFLSSLRLFAPVVGIPALQPPAVALVFGCFVLYVWLQNLKIGLGIFVHIDIGKRRHRYIVGPSAPELLTTDRRPPIVYLRSFAKERSRATILGRLDYIRNSFVGFYVMARQPTDSGDFSSFLRKRLAWRCKQKLLDSNRSPHDEQALFAEFFSEYGPYIAIGRPGEAFESMDLGAAKYYIPDEEWKTKVVELINSSGAIVIEAAESEGLSWEIREVLSRIAPEKLLIILPRNDADYREFCVFSAGLFPHPMPEELPNTRLIMFGADWSPIPLENFTLILEDALQPFVDRLNLISSHDKKTNHANEADAKNHAAD